VLGTGPGAVKTASALGLQMDATPSPDEASYIAVLEGESAFSTLKSLVESGTIPIAIVALSVPSAILVRMAKEAPPIVVGVPDTWKLQAALERGNSQELIDLLERQARIEHYLVTPGAA